MESALQAVSQNVAAVSALFLQENKKSSAKRKKKKLIICILIMVTDKNKEILSLPKET
jgi:hypothetical protein